MYKILLAGLLCASSFLSLAEARCERVVTRKEFRKLTEQERKAFFDAIKDLNKGSKPTEYDKFALEHIKNNVYAHGQVGFLVWHRQFLINFEKKLQEKNKDLAIPYWNWSFDSQAPEFSGLFTKDYFGGNGDATGCIKDGVFKDWKVYYDWDGTPRERCLQRRYAEGDSMGAFYSPEAIKAVVDQCKTYSELTTSIEGAIHGGPHVGIGGDMATHASPNDPVFWLHHAFIDKVFYDWQIKNPNAASQIEGIGPNNTPLTNKDTLRPFKETVGSVANINDLCYNYADDNVEAKPVPSITITSTVSPTPTGTTSSTNDSTLPTPTPTNSNSSGNPNTSTSTSTGPSSSNSSTTGSGAPTTITDGPATPTPTSTDSSSTSNSSSSTSSSSSNPTKTDDSITTTGSTPTTDSTKTDGSTTTSSTSTTDSTKTDSSITTTGSTSTTDPTKTDDSTTTGSTSTDDPNSKPTPTPTSGDSYPTPTSGSSSSSITTTTTTTTTTSPAPVVTNIVDLNVTIPVPGKPTTEKPGEKLPEIPIDAPDANDREDPYKIRVPKPLPESWCKMNNLKVDKVKAQEKKLAQVITVFNKVNIISSASLCKRPDLASHINKDIPVVALPKIPPLPKAHKRYTKPVTLVKPPKPVKPAVFEVVKKQDSGKIILQLGDKDNKKPEPNKPKPIEIPNKPIYPILEVVKDKYEKLKDRKKVYYHHEYPTKQVNQRTKEDESDLSLEKPKCNSTPTPIPSI